MARGNMGEERAVIELMVNDQFHLANVTTLSLSNGGKNQ